VKIVNSVDSRDDHSGSRGLGLQFTS